MDLSAFAGTECNLYRQKRSIELAMKMCLGKFWGKRLTYLHRTLITINPNSNWVQGTILLLQKIHKCAASCTGNIAMTMEWRLLAQLGTYMLGCTDRGCHVSSMAKWKSSSIDSIAHKIRYYINIVDSVSACFQGYITSNSRDFSML